MPRAVHQIPNPTPKMSLHNMVAQFVNCFMNTFLAGLDQNISQRRVPHSITRIGSAYQAIELRTFTAVTSTPLAGQDCVASSHWSTLFILSLSLKILQDAKKQSATTTTWYRASYTHALPHYQCSLKYGQHCFCILQQQQQNCTLLSASSLRPSIPLSCSSAAVEQKDERFAHSSLVR